MDWFIRIELWDYNNGITIPERIQIKIDNVHKNLHNIMKHVASKMDGWKNLERHEPAISTHNEEKQIRMWFTNKNTPFIEFRSDHSTTKEKLSFDEWKQFSKLIESEINEIIHTKCGILLISDLTT